MSGYSDKEYLKAAIKLKSVSYIEKPIKAEEVLEAIQSAKNLYLQKKQSQQVESLYSLASTNKLALLLTGPYVQNQEKIFSLASELFPLISNKTSFVAYIVKYDLSFEHSEYVLRDIQESAIQYLNDFHLNCICTEKQVQYHIYYIFGDVELSSSFQQELGNFFIQLYRPFHKYMVASGDIAEGIQNAYYSYSSAVILQQNSYFFQNTSYLSDDILKETGSILHVPPANPIDCFSKSLVSKDKTSCDELLQQLYQYFYQNPSVLPNHVKDLYYKLFLSLEESSMHLSQKIDLFSNSSIVEVVQKCFTYQDLHQILCSYTEKYFSMSEDASKENSTILLIKDFISKNYGNETLSVKDIGNQVYLSASYVCTFFKNETGMTLNQYLTEFRMQQAKLLLENPDYKINEISSMVGYSDGHYFGKSFKKYYGISPSEFRENKSNENLI